MQLGLVVDEDLNLLAIGIEGVAGSGIEGSDILLEGYLGSGGSLHVGSTLDECLDVVSGNGDRQQAYGSEHREAATHIVGDDEALVAFVVGCSAGSTTLGVGNSYDDLAGNVDAALVFTLLLEQTEGEGSLGSGT